MKIMMLTPCLMLENTRPYNQKALASNKKHLPVDEIAIYDQGFEERDFIDGISYVGHQKDRAGWVKSRNGLLDYFYDSDFDYAFWIDANSTISNPTVNDLVTILNAVKAGKLNHCDSIFSTLGMWVSGERIQLKSEPNFLEEVTLIPNPKTKAYNWMHGLIHKNFRKYYDQRFIIDDRCNVKEGTAEDVFFSRLLNRYTASYVAPTVVLNKPSSQGSCDWANAKGTYDYPPVQYDVVDRYIFEASQQHDYKSVAAHKLIERIVLPREDYMKDKVKPYKSRSKKTKQNNTGFVVPDLF